MGAVPSRECASLFSYFRGSYEVGMVPLTKYYFGNETDATTASVDAEGNVHRSPLQRSNSADSRSHVRQQLRQQLLLMRRDPAVLYANARDVQNVLQSLSRQEDGNQHKSNSSSETRANSAETASLSSSARGAKVASTPAATDVATSADHNVNENSGAARPEPNGPSDIITGISGNEHSSSNPSVQQKGGSSTADSCAVEQLFRNYWSVMPDNNFTEADLDRFLDVVDSTLFDTNEELLSADPVLPGTAAAPGTSSAKPFMPVPCALCLAYPDGKEREGALALDGRVINIIGYFGLMTREMQDAFKVVKRLPSEWETQQQRHAHKEDGATGHLMFLNTAILTSAGDRTLERVLVLAAVMLRQQFHTIGRRHVLQAKLNQLLHDQHDQRLSVDPQMVHYLQTLLAIPLKAEQPRPFFDPLLEIPLPSVPSGIYTPTLYVNAASNETVQHSHVASLSSCGRAALGSPLGEGRFPNPTMGFCVSGADESSSPHMRSLQQDRPSSMDGAHSTSGADIGHVPLYPQQNASGVPIDSVLGVALNASGPGFGSEGTCPPLINNNGGSLGANVPMPSPPVLGPLPLCRSDEDAITLALCRRMQQCRVVIEAASNNYSALKSLTENFAFLCCQILLDPNLITMELIELPALVETPSFKPTESSKTVATTLGFPSADDANACTTTPRPAADAEKKQGSRVSTAQAQLPPSSSVLIKLDPQHVCQATMWASSFFHCPMLLPSGGWVKYKLKDESEQLRHVLQNKDMLIAHWRKTDVDHAGQYLGKHTARLLEHVRALQAETEEARAFSAQYWMQQPLYVNQDGRKYGLYQSRYGAMLIGVRAFTPGNGSSAIAATSNTKEEHSCSTKTTVENNAASLPGRSTPLATHAGQASTVSGSRHSANSGSGSGVAIASRGAAPRSGVANATSPGHHSIFISKSDGGMNAKNVSHNSNISERCGRSVGNDTTGGGGGNSNNGPYVNYQPHTANINNSNGTYAPAPFTHLPVYMSKSNAGHEFPPYMMGGNSGRPGEAVPYYPPPSVSGYLLEMAGRYNAMPPQHQQSFNIMSTIPNPHKSTSAHHSFHPRVGSSGAHATASWPAMQTTNAQMPPPLAPGHINSAPLLQQQSEVMGNPSGFAYAAAPSSMSYKAAPPTYYAASQNTNPSATATCTLVSSPQSPPMAGEQVNNSPLRAVVSATSQLCLQSAGNSDAQHGLIIDAPRHVAASLPLTDVKAPYANGKNDAVAMLSATVPFLHGCIGMNSDDVGAAGNCLASTQCNGPVTRSSSDPHATKTSDESEIAHQATAPKAAVLRSMMPWSLQGEAGWASNEDATDDTAQFLLCSTELLDTDENDRKKEPADCNSNNNASCGVASEEELGVNRLMAGQDMFVANAAHQLSQSMLAKSTDMSIMNMLLAAPLKSPPSDTATSSAVGARQLAFPTISEPPKSVPAPPFQPGGIFPVYVLQLPGQASQQQQQQQQQSHPRPQLTTASPLPAAAPPTGKPLYYAMANGVPFFVQPAAAPGGLSVTYPNGQPFPHNGDGGILCPSMYPPPPPQQPPIHMMQHSQAIMSTSGLDGRPVSQLPVQPDASWGSQYHLFSSSPNYAASASADTRTPACRNSNDSNPFQAGSSFS